MNKPIIMLGAGGHASVLIDLLLLQNRTLLGVVAPEKSVVKNRPDISYLGNDHIITQYSPDDIELVNGVGAVSVEKNVIRRRIYLTFKEMGYHFATLVHPFTSIASTVSLAEGSQVMAGCVIQANSHIGENTIINTGACIDHDAQIDAHVHIAPGAVLSGQVRVGECSHVGVGAKMIQNIQIEKETMIRSGALVARSTIATEF